MSRSGLLRPETRSSAKDERKEIRLIEMKHWGSFLLVELGQHRVQYLNFRVKKLFWCGHFYTFNLEYIFYFGNFYRLSYI